MKQDSIYENLVNILNLFKDRPYHLAKYLMDNNAFNDKFLSKVEKARIDIVTDMNFKDISQMQDYYNSILDENLMNRKKTFQEVISDLNNKLNKLIEEEKYEDASYLRDYMIKHNIPRFK
jgi:excinuclease UvrABC helicase subunit UvrB